MNCRSFIRISPQRMWGLWSKLITSWTRRTGRGPRNVCICINNCMAIWFLRSPNWLHGFWRFVQTDTLDALWCGNMHWSQFQMQKYAATLELGFRWRHVRLWLPFWDVRCCGTGECEPQWRAIRHRMMGVVVSMENVCPHTHLMKGVDHMLVAIDSWAHVAILCAHSLMEFLSAVAALTDGSFNMLVALDSYLRAVAALTDEGSSLDRVVAWLKHDGCHSWTRFVRTAWRRRERGKAHAV